MPDRVIEWEQRPFGDGWDDIEPDATVWVDVLAFDVSWQRTDQYLLPGGSNGQGARYSKVGTWFADNSRCETLIAGMPEGEVEFSDGRHRFAWLRDHGVKAIPLRVPPDLADEFSRRFNSSLRLSVIPI